MNRCLNLYVSPQGNDENTGAENAPFLTLEKALDVYYQKTQPDKTRQDQQGPNGVSDRTPYREAQIILEEGTYPLSKPLCFEQNDSFPLEIKGKDHQTIKISGGQVLDHFQETTVNGKKAWYTQTLLNASFEQLFVNDERRDRPIWPADGSMVDVFSVDDEKGNSKETDDWQLGSRFLTFDHDDIKEPFQKIENVQVCIPHKWVYERMPIQWMDMEQKIIKSKHKSVQRVILENHKGIFENVWEAFNEPGQWYLDQTDHLLYYIPYGHENIDETTLIYPNIEKLMIMDQVSNKSFSNLIFCHTQTKQDGIDMDDGKFSYKYNDPPYATSPQAEIYLNGSVELKNTKNIHFDHCDFTRLGQYGIKMKQGVLHTHIHRCAFYNLGGGGILGGTVESESEKSGHITVSNSHFHHLGLIYKAAIGIIFKEAHHLHIHHNHIHDLFYSAISCGWMWGYKSHGTHSNIIEYNHIHDLGKGVLSDMGGIYTLGIQPGTIIRYNHIHDITDNSYGGWGIYLDEGSSHICVEYNLCYRMNSNGFHQHYGSENRITNNIFAMSNSSACRLTKSENHQRVLMQRNIFVGDQATMFTAIADPKYIESDFNLFWSYEQKEQILFEKYLNDYETGEKISFDQWRGSGNDVHSIIEDPLFTDPHNGDFTLSEHSPAAKIGFRFFDVSKSGISPAQ